jgi:hypothetical protein
MRLGGILLLGGLTLLVAACENTTSPTSPGPSGIHPQPQPNRTEATFTAPCNASKCGDAPSSLKKPRCKPAPTDCGWSEDTSVSYRGCEEKACGTPPGPETCPSGTTFKGNSCGAENEGPCAWNTVCAPPPSTTPCPNAEGCGGKPEIGVICKDGSTGDLACMQFDSECRWQRTCE